MPIYYDISPELDLLLYNVEGECNANEYFDLYHRIYADERRHHGMRVLIDVLHGELSIELSHLHQATAIITENRKQNFPPDRVAFITRGDGLKKLLASYVLLTNGLLVQLEVFNNFHDAIRWLGLAEREDEANQFWKSLVFGKK